MFNRIILIIVVLGTLCSSTFALAHRVVVFDSQKGPIKVEYINKSDQEATISVIRGDENLECYFPHSIMQMKKLGDGILLLSSNFELWFFYVEKQGDTHTLILSKDFVDQLNPKILKDGDKKNLPIVGIGEITAETTVIIYERFDKPNNYFVDMGHENFRRKEGFNRRPPRSHPPFAGAPQPTLDLELHRRENFLDDTPLGGGIVFDEDSPHGSSIGSYFKF